MRFRYYLDFGSGFVLVNTKNNSLKWVKTRDINPVIQRIKLDGSISFVGTEYTNILNLYNSGEKYIDIKIEQNVSGTWKTIFIGNSSLLTAIDYNRKLITLKQFNNSQDYYDNILSNWDIKYALDDLSLTTFAIKTPSVSSETIYAAKVAGTGYDEVDYKKYYDINGIPNLVPLLWEDPRWQYFLYQSTNTDGSHNYQTMSYDFPVFGFTEIAMIIGGKYKTKYVKLPLSLGASESVTSIYGNYFKKLGDIINELIHIANVNLSFDENTGITYSGQSDGTTQYATFDIKKLHLGEVADVAGLGGQGSEISLKYILELMGKAFDLHWYIEGTSLKFKHISEITKSGTLDIASKTQNLKRIEYFESVIPDKEVFRTKDASGIAQDTFNSDPFGAFQIYYRNSNLDLSKKEELENNIDINTNAIKMHQGLIDPGKNNFALIETIDETTSVRTIQGTYPLFNVNLSSTNLFGHLNKWRFGDSANLATRLKIALVSLTEIKSRPLRKLANVQYNISDLSTLNLDVEVISSFSNGGWLWQVSQDLNTDYAELLIRY